MPVSEELSSMDLAQELMLYPRSTIRGLELVLPRLTPNQSGHGFKRRRDFIDEVFPTDATRESFLEQMAEDAYWILNWPARNAKLGDTGMVQWRKMNDFHLNRNALYDDLGMSRWQRKLLREDIPTILEGRRDDCDFKNIQDKTLKEKLRRGSHFFRAAPRSGWVPFVLKDLIIDPKHGCFVTDFESSEVIEDEAYGVSDHELLVYGVLHEFLTLAVVISDRTEKGELGDMIFGGSVGQKSKEYYQMFYECIKAIYIKVLKKLTEQNSGEIQVRLSEDENEIEVILNYRDTQIPSKTFQFHILDFIKM